MLTFPGLCKIPQISHNMYSAYIILVHRSYCSVHAPAFEHSSYLTRLGHRGILYPQMIEPIPPDVLCTTQETLRKNAWFALLTTSNSFDTRHHKVLHRTSDNIRPHAGGAHLKANIPPQAPANPAISAMLIGPRIPVMISMCNRTTTAIL